MNLVFDNTSGGFPYVSSGHNQIVSTGFVGSEIWVPRGFKVLPWDLPFDCHTNAGSTAYPVSSRSEAEDLRYMSGLTAAQLAGLLGISRRRWQGWLRGENPSSNNRQKMQRLLTLLQRLSRGSAKELRSALLLMQPDGIVCYNLLLDGEYDEVIRRLENRRSVKSFNLPPLSHEALSKRKMPAHPVDLLGARQETIHAKPTERRVVRPRHRK